MTLDEFYQKFGSRITQDSERLFVDEFLYPLLGSAIEKIEPQFPFIDRSGRQRRIDFAYHGATARLALEVNGETYHAEGIIPDAQFDDNLYRQSEILRVSSTSTTAPAVGLGNAMRPTSGKDVFMRLRERV